MREVETRRPESASARTGRERSRALAEWVSLGVSLAIVLGLVGALLYDPLLTDSGPAAVAVTLQPEAVRQEGEFFYLPARVVNRGEGAAEAVHVRVSLTTGGGAPETAEVVIDFLAGGATEEAVFAFQRDPSQGRLVATIGFAPTS